MVICAYNSIWQYFIWQQQMHVTRKMINHAHSIVMKSLEYKNISESLTKAGDLIVLTYTYIDSPEVEPMFAGTLQFTLTSSPYGIPCARPNPEITFFCCIKSEKIARIVKESE
jgi:hypothetical protein